MLLIVNYQQNLWCTCAQFGPWASAHRGKLGQLSSDTPGKMDEKIKSENRQKKSSFLFMLYFESNQGRQV